MKKLSLLITTLSLVATVAIGQNQSNQKAKYINPFIGASTNTDAAGVYHGLGKTFPGAATPFGMVQVSPNTITGGDNGPGYSHEHQTIEGFAFTQMSGIGWYGDLGNFLVMPTTGSLKTIAGKENDNTLDGYRSKYDKTTETASAGYYSALLTDYNIKAECTAAPHSGMLRFTFPENKQSRIQIDLARRVGGTSTQQYIKVVDKHTIQGWMLCTPDGGGWGNGDGKANYTVYFYARFSKPLANYGFWSADIPEGIIRKRKEVTSNEYLEKVAKAAIIKNKKELEGKHIGFFTEFATQENEPVEMKVGISFVDIKGAENNFKKEIADKSFDQVCQDAKEAWNKALCIEIETKSEELKHIFYTALYHTMIDPRISSDVDGRYRGGNGKIIQTSHFDKRTIFSGWDVFRSQFPLQTIINPKMVNDEINTLITLAEETGTNYFERWEFFNAYSGCMIGNPAISVLTDAYMKGIRSYDLEKAYQIAVNTSKKFSADSKGYFTGGGSISNTLEYAYGDWCLGILAKELGKTEDAAYFLQKGQNYRNIYNPQINWFQPKNEDGTWVPYPRDGRFADGFACVESNPYQQGWFVPHDIEGMTQLMGGKEAVKKDLENFFSKAPTHLFWNDYYNHANEPVHHVPFIFNQIGYPWLTQKWSRHICLNGYKNAVDGLVGNEDVGQMSAWYVLASIGIHPLCPGSTRYEITSPIFDSATIRLPENKTFTIRAKNNTPENTYIQRATLNNKPYNHCYIDHFDIVNGGELVLEMGSTPNMNWGK